MSAGIILALFVSPKFWTVAISATPARYKRCSSLTCSPRFLFMHSYLCMRWCRAAPLRVPDEPLIGFMVGRLAPLATDCFIRIHFPYGKAVPRGILPASPRPDYYTALCVVGTFFKKALDKHRKVYCNVPNGGETMTVSVINTEKEFSFSHHRH